MAHWMVFGALRFLDILYDGVMIYGKWFASHGVTIIIRVLIILCLRTARIACGWTLEMVWGDWGTGGGGLEEGD